MQKRLLSTTKKKGKGEPELRTYILEFHRLNKFRLDSLKIKKELEDRGLYLSHSRVARLTKELRIRSITHKKFKVVTNDSNHDYIPLPIFALVYRGL